MVLESPHQETKLQAKVHGPSSADDHDAPAFPNSSDTLLVRQERRRGRPRKERPAELTNLAQNSAAQDRLKVLALYLEGKYSYQDIAWATGRSRDSVRTWIRAWKSGGMDALLRPADKPVRVPHRLTHEARESLLSAMAEYRWTTAQQAWRWVRDELGIEVCYLTVWRFLAGKGLFAGGVMHSRKLNSSEALVRAA